VAERAYLSIGEVLSLLKDEFPDITISKIRFLESQGLLDPERTPSGYRKFYDADVDRLRWILRQQREHFLPLKVIKGRLGDEPGEDEAHEEPVHEEPVPVPSPEAVTVPASPGRGGLEPRHEPPVTRRPVVPPALPAYGVHAAAAAAEAAGTNVTLDELSQASGLTHSQVRELEGYGLLTSRPVGGTNYYDDEAVAVASMAAGFLRFGVEARHLRAYKSGAEREAGQFEAIVLPLLKQRNPQARQQALDTLDTLSALAEGLRSALLRQALRDLTGT
jgi:DNA-binding transcriptional MerR regulator